ncbi:MAG: VOC family protein [Actinomycetota bacterium]
MVSIETHALHAISWVDLAARDVDAATEFYAGLFGWTSFNDGETPYFVFQADGRPVAGVMALTPEMGEMPPVWSIYVNVADADATCGAATAAGGVVVQAPFEIPGGGRIAVIVDPAGAAICLFEGMADNGIKAVDEVGAPCWYDCVTRDLDASVAFYEALFGWSSSVMEFEDMSYTMFANDGEPTCGAMAMPPMVPELVPSHWVANFVVDDADAAAAFVAANGGAITMPPTDTPFGRSVGIADPWGAVMTLIDRSTATAEPPA